MPKRAFDPFVVVVSSVFFLPGLISAYRGWISPANRSCHPCHVALCQVRRLASVEGTVLTKVARDSLSESRSPVQAPRSSYSLLHMGLRGKKIRRHKRQAQEILKTPARVETAYGPIRFARPPRVCDACRGRGLCRCSVCEGRGVVRASGMRKRNQLPRKLEGSLWTSVEVYRGHRHHTVVEVRGSPRSCGDSHQVRMRNCCGTTSDSWIPVDEIREKRVWRMGWLTLEDIRKAVGGPIVDARLCFRCKGGKILPCIECDGKGEIPSYEPLYEV
jgi:hypothetical protein